MEIKHLLAFISLAIFTGYFLLSKYPRRSYILFLLVLFPFIDLNVTPEDYGSISMFDFVSYFALFFLLEDFIGFSRANRMSNAFVIILITFLFIGSIKSELIGNSILNLIKFISIFIFSKILIEECIQNTNFITLIIRTLKLGCIISLIFLMIQIIIGIRFTFYPDINPNVYIGLGSETLRFPSYFQDPQKYAQYLSMMGFLFLINRGPKSTPHLINYAILLIVILAILLTGSRAGFFGLLAGLLFFVLFNRGKIWVIAFSGLLIGYFIVTSFPEYFSLLNRGENLTSSFGTRYEIWKEGVQIFLSNPLLGIGIGNHHYYIVNHSISGYYLIDDNMVYYGTESGYLQILIECGLLGFTFLLFLVINPIINAVRSYRNSNNINIVLIISSLISWMTAYITINSLSDNRILVVVATLICLSVVARKSPETIHG